MSSSPSLTTAPLPLSGQSGIGWSIRRPSPGRPGDGRHDQLGNFQTALLGRITPASTPRNKSPRGKLVPQEARIGFSHCRKLLNTVFNEANLSQHLPFGAVFENRVGGECRPQNAATCAELGRRFVWFMGERNYFEARSLWPPTGGIGP